MMIFRLAWRNIWRNRRRSLIILASVVIGLAATIFADNVMRGFVRQAFENQLGSSTGHMQVHHPGFRDNPVVENYMAGTSGLFDLLKREPAIRAFSKRAIANGIVSTARNSTGARIVGIEPDEERRVTTVASQIIEGTYLSGASHEVVVSEALSRTLDARLGERIVAMASNSSRSVGSEVFRVVGIYRSPNAAFDKTHLFVPIGDLQTMQGVGDHIAEIAIILERAEMADELAPRLQQAAGSEYEILSYRKLLPGLTIQLELTEQSMGILYAIIGLAMLFGIANTMLMSVFERIHEFGVIKSIGLKDRALFGLVIAEASLLGLLGILFGTAAGMLVTAPFFGTGINFAAFSEGLRAWGAGAIIYPVVDPMGILQGLLIIEVITIAAAILPAVRAMRLLPVDAMRHV